jgi:polyisoprenoid-binding protein YceI
MKMILGAVLFVVVAIVGYAGYSIFKSPAQASGPTTSIPISQATQAPAATTASQPAAAATTASKPAAAATTAPVAVATTAAAPAASSGYGAPAQAKPAATTAAEAPAQAKPAAPPVAAAAPAPVFEIDQSASKAKFIIDEILNGSPKTVIGETSQVAGQIAADLKDIDAAKVGAIRVNARTLTTDATSRNRMIQNQILQTEQHEFITFTPTQMVGLPETATVGQAITFKMIGNLSIKGQERPATFDVVMTPTADNRLEGTAKTTIKYAEWGVSVPKVPSVAGVSDDLGLELNFVAKPA